MARNKEKRGMLSRFVSSIALIVNVFVALGLIASGYSGMVSPEQCKYAVVMVMTFPAWLLAAVVLLLLDLMIWRRTALVMIIAMVICWKPIGNFSPLHLPKFAMSEEQEKRSFSLMTYNVWQFRVQQGLDQNVSNSQLDYVLMVDPDIVCIEEAEALKPTIRNNITDDQIADLHERYQYIDSNHEFAFMSKYPAERLEINYPKKEFRSGDINAWKVKVHGEEITIFGVHLRSFAFTQDQRALFRDITDGEDIKRSDIREAKRELMPLLLAAAIERAEQVRLLEEYIHEYGGENVIVCGDFNDTVGCYSLYRLEKGCDLHQVYSKVGFGPMVTYNANNFYFRIDHILYRGAMKPYSLKRGDLRASDHYPLTATFVLDN